MIFECLAPNLKAWSFTKHLTELAVQCIHVRRQSSARRPVFDDGHLAQDTEFNSRKWKTMNGDLVATSKLLNHADVV